MTQPTPEQLEAEIEVQRAQLADTVDQLTQKLDVKAQAQARIEPDPADDVRRVRGRRDPGRAASCGGGAVDEQQPEHPGPRPDRAHHARPRRPAQARRADRPREADLVVRRPQGAGASSATTSAPTWPRRSPTTACWPSSRPRSPSAPSSGWSASPEKSVQTVLDVMSPARLRGRPRHHRAPLLELATSQTAGLALVHRLAAARCGRRRAYVGAFGRAMNRIYEIGEGRPFWKLRP